MKKVVLIVILIITACQSFEKAEKPDDFYGDEKMAEILAQLYLFEGLATSNRRAVINKGIQIDQYIYDRFKTDSITFQKNFNYYTDREQEYADLLLKVEALLESERDSLSKRLENNATEIKPVDSIKSKYKSYPNN